jgi:pantoate--beta-alanine ligase
MDVIRDNDDARHHLALARRSGLSIGLVPTMGALHEGHRQLIRRARAENDRVVVSIFVNPTQFGPGEDFDRYPRDLDTDLETCEGERVDWVYAPEVSALYPHGPGTLVVPPASLTDRLCGASRPGHFTGVATVVAKLFALWLPDRAYFGIKDFQQTVVVRRMAEDLCLPVSVVTVPTQRESDGLALSSRNVFLSPEERRAARALPLALQAGWETARRPHVGPADVLNAARSVLAAEPALEVQYLELVDPDSLAPLTAMQAAGVLAVAAHVGRTRLIDNVSLAGPAPLDAAGSSHPERTP